MEFIPVTHSVPHGFATAFHTPQGVLMHTGDWKLDLTPVDGRLTDLARMGAIAYDQGVRLLIGDSTNADTHGHSRSEKSVGAVLYDLFHEHEGRRIVIACFASHVHRVQQIADAAIAFGRKVATLGLSMKKNMRLAREMGLLHIPESSIVDIEDIGDLADGDVCVISTGSQGEPMSALTRMANSENRWLTIGEGDTVILSSHPIPGNEMERQQGDRRARPPRRQGRPLRASRTSTPPATPSRRRSRRSSPSSSRSGSCRCTASTATSWPTPSWPQTMGVPAERTLVCADGDQLTIDDDGIRVTGQVPAATSTWTASSATSARACSATGGCSPRRAWSWSS